MKPDPKTYAAVTAIAVFIGLPVLFYLLGDAPRRSYLKEGLSILTLVSFSLMLGQFFLARSNRTVPKFLNFEGPNRDILAIRAGGHRPDRRAHRDHRGRIGPSGPRC